MNNILGDIELYKDGVKLAEVFVDNVTSNYPGGCSKLNSIELYGRILKTFEPESKKIYRKMKVKDLPKGSITRDTNGEKVIFPPDMEILVEKGTVETVKETKWC